MKRRGFTLIEVLIASLISTMVAGAVIGTIRAVTDSTKALDISAQAMSRVARAEARIADHANRARMILDQSTKEILLWLPTEPFTSSATNTSDYDAIQGNELAWYVMNTATGTLSLVYTTNRNDHTKYSLSTNWANLRTSLTSQGALTSIAVLEGLTNEPTDPIDPNEPVIVNQQSNARESGFRVQDSDPCSVRRFSFDGYLRDDLGGLNVQLSGRLLNGQNHPDCP